MPCRPGPTPVRIEVWFVSVTLGNSATAPPRRAQPCSRSRPTAGTRQEKRCPGLDDVETAVLAAVATVLREVVARRVHDGKVRRATTVREQREKPLGGMGGGGAGVRGRLIR